MTEAVETTQEAAPEPTLAEVAAQVFGTDASDEQTEAKAEAVEAEKPVEEQPKEPAVDKVGSRIAAAKKAEQRAAQERLEIRAQKEAQERRAAELDAREKKLRLLEEDPVRAFDELKLDPKTFLDKLAGDYKPEAVATKKLTAVEEELQRLKSEIAQRAEAEKLAQSRAQSDASWKAAASEFVSFVGEQSDKYPHLTQEFTEDQATSEAYAALMTVVGYDPDGKPVTRNEAYRREHGVYPDHEVVAEYLDTVAKQRVEARNKSAWRKQGNGAAPASQALGDPKSVPSVKGTSPRTLTSRDASQKSTAPKPWSQETADEESIRILEKALRKSG